MKDLKQMLFDVGNFLIEHKKIVIAVLIVLIIVVLILINRRIKTKKEKLRAENAKKRLQSLDEALENKRKISYDK